MNRGDLTKIHIFPAGEYIISDPCYVIRDEDWEKVLDETGFFGLSNHIAKKFWDDGLYEYNGQKCFAHGTVWGDGEYKVKRYLARTKPFELATIGVDAGLIGTMPTSAVTDPSIYERDWLAYQVTFPVDFATLYVNGTFFFGNLFIETE